MLIKARCLCMTMFHLMSGFTPQSGLWICSFTIQESICQPWFIQTDHQARVKAICVWTRRLAIYIWSTKNEVLLILRRSDIQLLLYCTARNTAPTISMLTRHSCLAEKLDPFAYRSCIHRCLPILAAISSKVLLFIIVVRICLLNILWLDVLPLSLQTSLVSHP